MKFFLNFRHDYALWGKRSEFEKQTYVFMIDGKTIHGGLSDRLRGAFSVYSYCKKNGKDFMICWTSPFALEDYLIPAQVDWKIDKNVLSHNLRDVSFKFFNTYTGLDEETKNMHKYLKSKKKEVHVYSNISIEENRYREYFHNLFKPAPQLQEAIDKCTMEIGQQYISVTFRFIGLLGDFKDDDRWLKQDERMDADYYINHSRLCIGQLHKKFPKHKVLVTADSPTFLQRVSDMPYVYVIPGKLVHMDRTSNNEYDLHLKPFVDFYMVAKAERCFIYYIGNMFRHTRFAKTAALVGGKEIETITD